MFSCHESLFPQTGVGMAIEMYECLGSGTRYGGIAGCRHCRVSNSALRTPQVTRGRDTIAVKIHCGGCISAPDGGEVTMAGGLAA